MRISNMVVDCSVQLFLVSIIRHSSGTRPSPSISLDQHKHEVRIYTTVNHLEHPVVYDESSK